MQRFTIEKDSTSVILPIAIYDSSSSTGGKLTGLVHNTASLTAYYNRTGAAGAATAITLVTATKGTWVSSGFFAVDGTNMPGDYELHVPDAVLATGADSVLIQLKGAANMVPINIEIDLIPVRLTAAAISTTVWAETTRVLTAGTNLNNLSLADIFTYVIENSETFEQQLRLMRAESCGKVAVAGATVTFRNAADDADRITATTDSTGQRTAVTVVST